MNCREMNEVNGGFVFVIPALALYFGGASLACCAITASAYLGYNMNK